MLQPPQEPPLESRPWSGLASRLRGRAGGSSPRPLKTRGPISRCRSLSSLRASGASAARSVTARAFVLAGDSINGERITDRALVERIERIAAAVPRDLLAGVSAEAHVRYVAHGFGGGDDAPIYYGVFREPAAALAFGCALDEHFAHACEPAPLMSRAAVYEDPPGVHCRPMRLAMGAPVYEPDRCEAGG